MGEDLAATRVLAATVLVNLGSAGIVGAWASVIWLRQADSAWATAARRRSWTALRVSLAVTMLADGLLLWLQAADMGQVPMSDALGMLPSILTSTHVGHAWVGGAAGLSLVIWAVSERASPTFTARLVVVALAIALVVYWRAAVSHAGGFGLFSLQLLVECAHLWAISLWLGAVGIAAFAVLHRHHASTATDRIDVARWVRALSATATGALLVIVATGVFNAWRGLGSAANLVGTAYGNTLLVKVALVGVAVVLGGLNRFGAMPCLITSLQASQGSSAQPLHRFVQVLRIEAAVLFAALVAAAFVSSSPLPPATTSQQQL